MRIFFHVGKIKTGSTSIQYFLAKNYFELKKNKIFYSDYVTNWGGVPPAHFNFFYAAAKDILIELGFSDIANDKLHGAKNLDSMFSNITTNSLQNNCDTVIISCETFSQLPSYIINILKENRFQPNLELIYKAIINLFHKIKCDHDIDLKFIIFLREQSELFLSAYNQAVKGGSFFGSLENFCSTQMLCADNDDLRFLLTLEEIVGQDNMIIKTFEKNFIKGDIAFDFLTIVSNNLDKSYFINEKAANASLSQEIIEFRKFLGANLPKRNSKKIFYEFIFEDFQSKMKMYKSKLHMSSALRGNIQNFYLNMNREIALRYFPERSEKLYSHESYQDCDTVKPSLSLDEISKIVCEFIVFLDKSQSSSPQLDREKALPSGRASVLNILPMHGSGVEIGVHLGEFSEKILTTCMPKKLLLIDPWRYLKEDRFKNSLYGGEKYSQTLLDARYAKVKAKFSKQIDLGVVKIIRKTSFDAAQEIFDNSLDFVYVDGDHSYESVLSDLQIYYKKLKKDGLLIGSGYSLGGWWTDGVIRAFSKCIYEYNMKIEFVINSQICCRKT